MTIWNAHRPLRAVLTTALVVGSMALAATPVGASSTAPASGIKCGPKTVTPHPAPGVGKEESFTVGNGGTVTLLQRSNTALRVASADAKAGWKVNVVSRNGPRPHVGFQRVGVPNDQERFWARMNTTGTPGTVINTVIQSCT